MDTINQTTLIILATAFLLVSFLYSSVGLGGGSSYTALMAIFGVSYVLIPSISLTLNLVVTFIGMVNFYRGGHVRPKLILPFLITSMPMAFLGGVLHLSRTVFMWLLMITLVLVALRIYWLGNLKMRLTLNDSQRLIFSLALGAVLGFIAGTVGIGGGIYLVPLIIMFGIAGEKQAAATGAVFIWLNSIAGLIARVQRGAFDAQTILPLIAVVIVGGYLGSNLGALKFRPAIIQKTLGVAIVIAIVLISRKLMMV